MSGRSDDSSWWRRGSNERHDAAGSQPETAASSSYPDRSSTRSGSSTSAVLHSPGRQAQTNSAEDSWRRQGADKDDWQSIPSRCGQQEQQQQRQHSSSSRSAPGVSPNRYPAAQLVSKLRSASTPQMIEELLVSHDSIVQGVHLSAAFKSLSVMNTHTAAAEQLLHQLLLPRLQQKLSEAADAAAAAGTSADDAGSSSTSSRRLAAAAGTQQPQGADVLIDARACAVILTSFVALGGRLHSSSTASHLPPLPLSMEPQQPPQPEPVRASARSLARQLVTLFLTPAVQATAAPQAYSMVATAAAKLQVQGVGLVEVQQLLSGLLQAVSVADSDQVLPINISQALWGAATLLAAHKLRPPGSKVTHLMCDLAQLLVQDPHLARTAKPVELVNTLSAFVIAEADTTPGLVGQLVQGLVQQHNLERAIPQDLSRALWAVARLERGAGEVAGDDCLRLVGAMCRPATLSRAMSIDIANTLWGAANIRQQQQRLQQHSTQQHQWRAPLCVSHTYDEDDSAHDSHLWAVPPQQVEALVGRFLQVSRERRTTHTDVSALCWAVGALAPQLPGDLLQQLFSAFMAPHILAQVDQDKGVSTGISNIIWAASNLHKVALARNKPAPQVLTAADIDTLTEMLTEPSRLRKLTAADVSIAVSSLARLGHSLSQQQLSALLQRFLQPSALRQALPRNFQNVLWGVVRMGQRAVLQQPGLLQQLLQAWLDAEGPGRPMAGVADPHASASILWAVAMVLRGEDIHEKRWVEPHQPRHTCGRWNRPSGSGDSAASILLAQEDSSAASILLAQDSGSSHSDAVVSSSGVQPGGGLISRAVVQQLFDGFLKHCNLAVANAVDISTVLWAAAVLRYPLAADDLSWLLSAYLQPDRLAEATAQSITNVMYGVVHLQVLQQLQARSGADEECWLQPERRMLPMTGSSSSSSKASPHKLTDMSRRPQAQQENTSCAPALAKLTYALVKHIPGDANSHDLTAALLALTQAFAFLDSCSAGGSGRVYWLEQHQRLLHEALWALLQQMLLLIPGAAVSAGSAAAGTVAAAPGEPTAAEAAAPCSSKTSSSNGGISADRTHADAAEEVSLRPKWQPRWRQQQQQQQQQESCAQPRLPLLQRRLQPQSHLQQQLQPHAQPRQQQQQSVPCSLTTLVNAVWASAHLGIAHTAFLQAVCTAALRPWGGPTATAAAAGASAAGASAAGAGLQRPAVQQLPWPDVVCLLEKLASLNALTAEVWCCAVQPLLPDTPHSSSSTDTEDASTCDALRSAACNDEGSSSIGSVNLPVQLQVIARTTGFVPRLCWAAAVADAQACSGAVVQLVRLWLMALSQQQQQHLASNSPQALSQAVAASAAAAAAAAAGAAQEGCDGGGGAAAGSSSFMGCTPVLSRVEVEGLCQLWQVHMWLQGCTQAPPAHSCSSSITSSKAEGVTSSSNTQGTHSSRGLLAAMSAQELSLCEAAWKQQVGDVTPSQLQSQVAEVLRSIPGVSSVQLEGLTPDGCFSVDVLAQVTDLQALMTAAKEQLQSVPAVLAHLSSMVEAARPAPQSPALQLAVEADGPSHFLLTGSHLDRAFYVLRGEARSRSRALAACGCVVVRVSHLDWRQQQQQQQTTTTHAQVQPSADAVGAEALEAERVSQDQSRLRCWLAAEVCRAAVQHCLG